MLSSRGAKIVVDYIDRVSFVYPADNMLIKVMDFADTPYTTLPHLVDLPPNAKGKMHGEGDIQDDLNYIPGGPNSPQRQEWLQNHIKPRGPIIKEGNWAWR